MKIRFLVRGGDYRLVEEAHAKPILPYLLEGSWEIASEPDAKTLNVSLSWEVFPKADVFMSHGLADKNWRNADKMAGFDFVFVSGPAWVEKLEGQGLTPERIRIVGYPYLDESFHLNKERSRVLWAPTHLGGEPGTSSWGRFRWKFIDDLTVEFNLIEAPHPAISGSLTRELYPWARAVIADAGSVVYEAWALGIPVVFPDWLVKGPVLQAWPGSFEAFIYEQGLGWHANSEAELLDLLRHACATRELGDGVDEFMEGIFPKALRGRSGEVAAKELLDLRETLGEER